VRYSFAYNNSFWNGSQVVYGDNDVFPLADDIVAHELTHGVTDYSSNLYYYYQSGAINESFSDLWGEAFDQLNGIGLDEPQFAWLIGEELNTGAVRSMSDPTLFGDPDKMTSDNYHLGDLENLNLVEFDNGGVHTNSGVNNKAVYLMVAGESFNGYTVHGIGWEKTLAIYYRAQTTLLNSGADYGDLYFAVQQACTSLIGGVEGITADDCEQVKFALDAVQMNQQPADGFNPDAEICLTNAVVDELFFDGFETGTGLWELTTNSSTGSGWDWLNGYASGGAYMLGMVDSGGVSIVRATIIDYIPIPAERQYFLHFDHSFGFNYSYDAADNRSFLDGGVLQYQIVGGAWTDASSLFADGQDYNGTVSLTSDSGLAGESAFAADSHGYVSSRYDLSSLGGQSVRFRWTAKTDSYMTGAFWDLDEVRIYRCIPPAPAQGPSNVSASDGVYNNRVVVSWDAVAHASEYQIWRDSSSSVGAMAQIGTSLSLAFSDLAVSDLEVYTYWVKACNESGCSPVGTPDTGYADFSVSGYLFEDDFETGDFSLWTRFNDGKGWLYPCAEAAVNENYGACVERGDNDRRKQLIDETPVDQTSFSARFNFDINSLSMSQGERFRFVQVKMGAERPFFIVLKYESGQYWIQLNTLLDDLTKTKTGWYLLTDSPHTIEIDWQASSTPGADDGFVELILDDVLLEALTGLDNDTIFIENFKVGFTSRLVGKSIYGVFFVDDVATSNAGHIGLP
jgi:hypothetical protein